MAGVFLTEGRRIRPGRSNKPKKQHPWRSIPIGSAAGTPRFHNPAHVTGVADEECLMGEVGLAYGCYAHRSP